MTVLACFALWLGQGQTPPKTVTFSDGLLNLQFERPATWKPGPPPLRKGQRPAKDTFYFTLPIKDTKEVAYLEIVRATFMGKIETWQSVQAEAFNQTKREVVKQWQQSILGVPMLCTKGVGIDGSTPRTYIAGLMYARGPLKLLMKLNAPNQYFDQVNAEVLSTLESLRTIDGSAIEPEDPNRKVDPNELKNRTRVQAPIIIKPSIGSQSNTGQAVPFELANRKFVLKAPTNFKVVVKGTQAKVSDETGADFITIDLASTLDSDGPKPTLFKHAAKTLDEFQTVANRVDTEAPNAFGCQVMSYWREGKTASGDLGVFGATIYQNEVYGFLSFRQPDLAKGREFRNRVLNFLGKLSIEQVK